MTFALVHPSPSQTSTDASSRLQTSSANFTHYGRVSPILIDRLRLLARTEPAAMPIIEHMVTHLLEVTSSDSRV
jgi:hypothetical protein